jgi:hypothetical protein
MLWIDKETLSAILAGEPGAPALDSIALFKGKRNSARLCLSRAVYFYPGPGTEFLCL